MPHAMIAATVSPLSASATTRGQARCSYADVAPSLGGDVPDGKGVLKTHRRADGDRELTYSYGI